MKITYLNKMVEDNALINYMEKFKINYYNFWKIYN